MTLWYLLHKIYNIIYIVLQIDSISVEGGRNEKPSSPAIESKLEGIKGDASSCDLHLS